jgi:XTP/dITP diphosphohydrolase
MSSAPLASTITQRPQRLILGTHNAKKCGELRLLLAPLGIQLQSLAEVIDPLVVEETGSSFIENARRKGVQQAVHLGEWTVGEDSGLCVPYLNGEPGIYSARYAGESATDEQNNLKLLQALEKAEGKQRDAYYVSTIVLASPRGEILIEAEGRCWGRMLRSPRGAAGFGYDPLFEIREYHKTFAELGNAAKSALSHRARALEHFLRDLRRLLA